MTKLAMFVPLAKADAAQRLVYGSIDETPDRAREIMDYATAKPAFQAWSEGLFKASGGKSFGNVRAQHDMKKAAGVLREISYDDDAKRISFAAHIVDDQEWAKVEAGVYTGFSPGGSYAKRWADTSISGHHRYTPKVGELSIVDVPCIPSGTFTMVKADGAEEAIPFVLDKAYEPGNDATKSRAEEMAKAAAGTTYKDHVVKARADLIAENATEVLAKMAEPDASAEPDRVDALDAALAKADTALAAPIIVINAASAYRAAALGQMLKDAGPTLAIAAPSPESVLLIGADFTKSLAAVDLIRSATLPLAKGLYSISDVAESLRSFAWIAQDVIWEASSEGDKSSLPQQAVDIVNALKGFLCALVQEEVAEMLASTVANAGDMVNVVIVDDGDADAMELANKIVDLVKADEARMAKAGARNSTKDAARIQTIHDTTCELGAACGADKVAPLAAENERLSKAVDAALPRLEKLTEELGALRTERDNDHAAMAKMADQITALGAQPGVTKIQAVIEKHQDGPLAKADDAQPGSIEATRDLSPAERQRKLETIAINARNTIPA
jgi:hypothetical protein